MKQFYTQFECIYAKTDQNYIIIIGIINITLQRFPLLQYHIQVGNETQQQKIVEKKRIVWLLVLMLCLMFDL